MSARRQNVFAGPGAVELIEESVHILRAAPKAVLALYFAGTAPFVLGVLFFWAYVTWFAPPPPVIAWWSCGLVLLFAAMKAAHADFCARLLALRLGAPAPVFSARRLLHLAVDQMRIQAWGLVALPIALVTIVPFGWVYAYFQSATVLCENEDAGSLAGEQAATWPGQNHVGLLIISLLFLAALLNVAGTFLVIPWFANHVLGIENAFGLGGWGWINTTFLASVICLSWLVTDPFAKAFYVLRVFYGRARTSGEDLRAELQKARLLSGVRHIAALAALLCALGGTASAAAPAAPAPVPAAVSPEKLDASISDVMAGRDFRWRLHQRASAEDEADGPIKGFVRKGVDMLRSMMSGAGRLWRRFTRWFNGLFPDEEAPKGAPEGSSGGASALRLVLYFFAAGVVILVGVIVYLVVTRGRAERRPAIEATGVTPALPDIADEGSHAGMLRTEEWLEVARAQLARGEWRLAWRALYLATLARLAADGLVSLAKSKTNLDYEREVRRRSLGSLDITDRFAARRAAYEDVWYGQLMPEESKARDWLAEMEGRRLP